MNELTMDEVQMVSGAMTTTQCIASYSLVGGIAGAVGGGVIGVGGGAMAGGGLGFAIGAAFGGLVCD